MIMIRIIKNKIKYSRDGSCDRGWRAKRSTFREPSLSKSSAKLRSSKRPFHVKFPDKILHEFLITTCQARLILLAFTTIIMSAEAFKLQRSSFCTFLRPPFVTPLIVPNILSIFFLSIYFLTLVKTQVNIFMCLMEHHASKYWPSHFNFTHPFASNWILVYLEYKFQSTKVSTQANEYIHKHKSKYGTLYQRLM